MEINNLKEKLKSLPFLGWFSRWIYNLLRLNNIKHNLFMQTNQIQEIYKQLQEIYKQLQEQDKKVNEQYKRLSFELADQLDIIEQKLDDKASVEDTIKLYNQLLNRKEKLLDDINKLDNIVAKADKLISKEPSTDTVKKISDIKEDKFAPFYKEFEDNFRGDSKEIKLSFEIYLPFIKNIKLDSSNKDILDIGCGRGEWLELLRDNNFYAKGIDINEEMIQVCQKRELHVQKTNALEYLKNLPSNSLSVITGFHIIEHFDDFDLVLELLYESYRVLKRGGIAIFETPNTRNILVGANDFYLDPTHNRPLHPLTMEFFLSKMGFKDTKILAINNKIFTDIKQIEFNSLEDYVTIGRNYALIGYKP